MGRPKSGFSTLAVHAGERYDPSTGAVGTPIHQTSTFYYPRKPDGKGGWVPNKEFIYSRYANPTVRATEEKIAALEGAESAICFSSGMAATSASVLSLVKTGDSIVAQGNIYGGTISLFNNELGRLGITARFSLEGDADSLAKLVTKDTRVVWVEAPSNPFGYIVDLPRLRSRLAAKWGSRRPRIIMDSTTATPVNFRPLRNGADLVMHSATKYLNGHSDIIAGCVAGPESLIADIRLWLKSFGGAMDPHQAFLLKRGLATLPLRMARHNENGERVAKFLSKHPAIESVWHPSLPSHPNHALGKSLMKGFGGIVAFQLRTRSESKARRFLERLELFAIAPSLGGVESLAGLPIDTQHANTPAPMRKKLGITSTFVRLCLGLEDSKDLIDDLKQGLRGL